MCYDISWINFHKTWPFVSPIWFIASHPGISSFPLLLNDRSLPRRRGVMEMTDVWSSVTAYMTTYTACINNPWFQYAIVIHTTLVSIHHGTTRQWTLPTLPQQLYTRTASNQSSKHTHTQHTKLAHTHPSSSSSIRLHFPPHWWQRWDSWY